jgi:hypothetical protein
MSIRQGLMAYFIVKLPLQHQAGFKKEVRHQKRQKKGQKAKKRQKRGQTPLPGRQGQVSHFPYRRNERTQRKKKGKKEKRGQTQLAGRSPAMT